jgi:hypothetical protein
LFAHELFRNPVSAFQDHALAARRHLIWINVTQNPTAEWVERQFTVAFPWDKAPGYLI